MMTQASPFRRCKLHARKFARGRSREQSGVALLTALLLLILLSILGLAMAVTTNSDMMINGYYGSYRGSFYAADSGLNIARATMSSQIQNQVNTHPCVGWGSTSTDSQCQSATGPLNGGTAASYAQTNVPSSSFSTLNSGQAANAWPENYMVPASVTGCTTSVTFPTSGTTNPQVLATSGGLNTSYAYTFNYTICSVGRAQALQQVIAKESGILTVTVTAAGPSSTPTPTSFAAFGAFINNFAECQGALVPGTMTGSFWTNGSWNFGTGGSYIYTDPVNQVDTKASFVFGSGTRGAPSCNGVSGCDCKNASSDSYNGQTIAPTFKSGFNRGQPAAALPTDSYSQEWAVIDGYGFSGTGHTESPSNPNSGSPYTTLNSYLKDINGTAYPLAGASSGVFMNYCTGALGSGCGTPTLLGSGFFIEDSGSVATNIGLSLGTTGGNPTQIYTITQGSTVTQITLNIGANTTTIVSGSKTLTLAGVPMNYAIPTPREGALLYVDGTISSLSGPGQGVASIQDYYGTTIAANGDIDITGDLIYKHEPVTLNSSDTLVAGNDYNQVLGIFTANGNIVLTSPYSNNNLETDATLAAIAQTCPGGSSSCGFKTGSGGVNTWTIVGGRVESYAHSVSISQGNTYFDRRFTSRTDGFAPPWFPATTVPGSATSGTPSAPGVITTTQRMTWVTWPQ